MNPRGICSRRMFLHLTALSPAAFFTLRAAAQQEPATTAAADLELDLPSVGGAPPLRLLGKRIFNCYKYLANLIPRLAGPVSAEEKNFVQAAEQLQHALDPFGRGIQNYFEFGMIEAGSEAELLAGLERQARLFSAGVMAAVTQALENYEREVWPRHRALIQEALPLLEKHFRSEAERLIATQAARLGFHRFPAQFTVSLIVPWRLGTMAPHPTVVSLTEVHGTELIERVLQELTRVLAFENAQEPGTARGLLEAYLVEKKLPPRARLQVADLLEEWAAGELVRERVDPAHVPSAVRRQAFESIARTHNLKLSEALYRAIWHKYLEGKVELEPAMQQLADALL